MATITFLPDRLNAEPVVFKGFTTPELFMTALFSFFGGLILAIPVVFLIGWLAFPTISLLMPLLVIILGGKFMSRFKRGKPENYLYRRFDLWLSRQGIGNARLVHCNRRWALRRTRRVIALPEVPDE
ncbi:TIGR03750 family conjugal transfer protein [Yersinia enterocolitica]|nr:TIGR03750 family conjugal transfer protein [Yersinia enterocolitica]EKN5064943.1 TIGR03750 family conjugal transfer protein [Yersinia enterocolitica]